MSSAAARHAFGEPCLRLSEQRVVHEKYNNTAAIVERTHTHTRIRARVVQHDFRIGKALGRVALSDDCCNTGGYVMDKQRNRKTTDRSGDRLSCQRRVCRENEHTFVYTRTQSTNEQDNDISSFSLAEIPCAVGSRASITVQLGADDRSTETKKPN